MNTPMFITKSAYFNFLREYWLGEDKEDKSIREMLADAAVTWQSMNGDEKACFESDNYVTARLVFDTFESKANLIRNRSAPARKTRKSTAKKGSVQKRMTKRKVAKSRPIKRALGPRSRAKQQTRRRLN